MLCDLADDAFERVHFLTERGEYRGVVMPAFLHSAEIAFSLGFSLLCEHHGIRGFDVLPAFRPAAIGVEEDEELQPGDPTIAAVIGGCPSPCGEEPVDVAIEMLAELEAVHTFDGRW